MKNLIFVILFLTSLFSQNKLTGKVFEKTKDGTQKPLIGANILWLGSLSGTTTDLNGEFVLQGNPKYEKVIVSYIGYKTDTVNVAKKTYIEISLESTSIEINDVKVVAQSNSSLNDYKAIENSVIMTKKELQKAACCNLAESFETNPSIDVSFTDAITGTKQIEMLGLSGIYTQSTLENLPYIRGLASNIGLTFLPGTWINSINVSKGVGSVVNGFESITGQIDINMQKPEDEMSKPVLLNLYGDIEKRFEGNLNLAIKLSDKVSFINLFHLSSRKTHMDINSDNFMDQPAFDIYNIMQRWYFHFENGWESQLGFQIFSDDKSSGMMDAINNYKYKYGSKNKNYNIYGKTGYVFQDNSGSTFGFQWSLSKFNTDSYFGLKKYSGEHSNGYFNFIFQTNLGNEFHTYKAGLSFLFDEFREKYTTLEFNRTERIPGVFFEYTFKPSDELSLMAGIRYDKHNFFGSMVSPRIHLRYAISEDLLIRSTVGRGYRTSNILTEYGSSFASARQLEINTTNNFGYGLEQENAWNYGINLTYYFLYEYRDASLSVDFHRTSFVKSVNADLESNPQKLTFYSVANGSYSNSFQLELNIKPYERFDTRIAYRYLDVKQKLNDVFKEKPYVSKHRAFINLAYNTEKENENDGQMLYDLTVQWFGKKRIPSTALNPAEFRVADHSPDFFLVNAQVTRDFGSSFDLYIGVENLFDYRQENVIIDARNPQSKYFDASMIWGPVNGRMIYTGIRYNL